MALIQTLEELLLMVDDRKATGVILSSTMKCADMIREDLLKDQQVLRALSIEIPIDDFPERDDCMGELVASTDRLAGLFRSLHDALRDQMQYSQEKRDVPPSWLWLSGEVRHSKITNMLLTYSELTSEARNQKRWSLWKMDYMMKYIGLCIPLQRMPDRESLDFTPMVRAVTTASGLHKQLGV